MVHKGLHRPHGTAQNRAEKQVVEGAAKAVQKIATTGIEKMTTYFETDTSQMTNFTDKSVDLIHFRARKYLCV